jgi:hypothetical protein
MTHAIPWWLVILVAFVSPTAARAQTTLNLSHDLVTLGIAATNMVPDQPALDAGPLLSAGVAYAMSHGIARVIADPGTYYFLSMQFPGVHVQLGSNPATPFVSGLTIDFQGADLIFTHPLANGLALWSVSDVVLQNFTADYQPLPFTQVRVISVDPATARIQYSVEPGWQDPTAFNSAQPLPGLTFPPVELMVYRNGRPAAGVRKIAVQTPLSGNVLTVVPYIGVSPTPAFMAGIRPGDVAVLDMRQIGSPVVTYRCLRCTLRNITVYSAAGEAITGMYSDSTVWERIYSIPKPGTDRLISAVEIGFQANGPNNQIRLSRAIRTIDGGISLHVWSTGEVQSQLSARTLTVAGVGPTTLSQGVTLPNGSPVVFQRRSDGAILFSATVVSQTGSVEGYNPNPIDFTFDRDLPANLIGTVMYTTDLNRRGANSVIERNTIQEKSCCVAMDTWGWAGSTIHGNYFSRMPWSAIDGIASTPPTTWTTPPLANMTFSNNVLDHGNLIPDWWLGELGALQLQATRFDPQLGDYDLFPAPAHQNITIADNFIADPGRAAIWIGDTAGGSVSGNYLLHATERPQLAVYHSPRTDTLAPLVIDVTSTGIVTANNTIDQTSGRVFVTDAQYRELAAYAPGSTIRLDAYGIGGLANPAVTLTDADGVTRPAAIQTTTTHAIDVQLPVASALGGAYLALTSAGTKYFGTLFVDSQDNIPAVNGCVYETSLSSKSVAASAGNLSVLVVTQPGCDYQVLASDPWVTPVAGGVGTGLIAVAFAANTGGARQTTIEIAGEPFTITQAPAPTMSLDRTSLSFAAVDNGATFYVQTSAQSVRMTQTGIGVVTWTASSNQPWLVVSPTSGTGTTTFTVSTQFVAGLAATQAGSITITLTGAGNVAGPISVLLNTIVPGRQGPAFGSFDTPMNGVAGVAGSIPVTGWALDDVQVTRVTVCREAFGVEVAPVDPNCAGNAQIYLGDGVFVDGARPDVQGLYSTMPLSSRAGWGYLLLTNFLPNLGNGTFNLHAYAFDVEGLTTALGVKTITCDNKGSTAPFGAIDVPGQGAVTSGLVGNTGWVLAPSPNFADPADLGTVNVYVDGTNVGSPGLWNARPDLTALFPVAQYPGISKALGIFGLDTTTLTSGVHTIFWLATGAPGGGTSGIGSRFFTVSNGAELLDPAAATTSSPTATVIASRSTLDIPAASAGRISSGQILASEVAAAPPDLSAVQGRRGFDLDLPLRTYTPSSAAIDVQAEELDRVELHLGSTGRHQYTGYLQTAGGLKPLPVGSSLDASTGTFTWMPGVGFYGAYTLTFVRWSGANAVARQDVRITLNAKGSNRVGSQTIIDAPRFGATVGSPFFVGGWAAELNSTGDTGVNTVHVWAYPVDARGNRLDPIFIGPAIYGGARPDVAAIYGQRFADSGYGIIVNGLVPGTYDIAVFAFSTVVNNFTPAAVVSVTVR